MEASQCRAVTASPIRPSFQLVQRAKTLCLRLSASPRDYYSTFPMSWPLCYLLYIGGLTKFIAGFIVTAVFRSIGHTIFVPRERRLSITTYLRFDRAKISLIFFLIAFLGLIFLFSFYLILQKTIGKLADGGSRNPAGLLINQHGLSI